MNDLLKRVLVLGGIGAATAVAARALVRSYRWFDFRGRHVLVTGGSRGLGLVLARQLVDAGARVTICARTAADLAEAEAELLARGGEVLAIQCDIRNRDDVAEMVEQAAQRFGPVEVLFNVAGTIQVGPLDAMTMQDFEDAMATNCWGPLNTTLAVLPGMKARRWGRIVNVASIGGKQAIPHMLPYTASKFALVGLSNGLRTELRRHGIYVTTVCPTLMRTGSAPRATFKGQHRKEYAWFSIGASLPGITSSAETAARQIITACQNGDREVIVGNPLYKLQRLAPGLVHEFMQFVAWLLPEMGGIGQQAARGYESYSRISPSILTRLGDTAAVANNELPLRRPK